MKKLIKNLSMLIATIISFNSIFANQWENYSNFSKATDMLVFANKTYITAKGGLLIVDNATGQKEYFTNQNTTFPSYQLEKIVKFNSSNATIYIGTYDNGLIALDNNQFESVSYPTNFGLLYNMKAGNDSCLYLQASTGVYKYEPTTKHYTKINDLVVSAWLYNIWSFDFNLAKNLVSFTGENCYTIDRNTLNILDSFSVLTDPLVTGCAPSAANLYYIEDDKHLLNVSDFQLLYLHRNGTTSDASLGLPSQFFSVKVIRGDDNSLYSLIDGNSIYKLVNNTWQFQYDLPTGEYADVFCFENNTKAGFIIGTNMAAIKEKQTNIFNKTSTDKFVFSSSNIHSLFKDNNGEVYASAETNIYKYDKPNNNWTLAHAVPSIFGAINSVRYIDGKIYAINTGNLLEYYDGTAWIQVPKEASSTQTDIFSYDVAPNGVIYFTNSEGLFKYEAGATTKLIATSINNTFDWFMQVKFDQFRNILWLTKLNKIIKYDFQNSSIFSAANTSSLPTNFNIYTIAIKADDASVWFGSQNNKVFTYDDFSLFQNIIIPATQNNYITQIVFTPNQKVLLGFQSTLIGFLEYDYNIFKTYSKDSMPSLVSNNISDLLVDNDGQYWAAHLDQNGVSVYKNNSPNTILPIETNKLFSLYPNPCLNELKIEGNIAKNDVSIFSLMGKKMGCTITNTTKETIVNTENLANGIYMVVVKNKSQLFSVAK